ncbi:MAG: hypothetical protein V3V00_12930 [Saprospiraceae bacterium]
MIKKIIKFLLVLLLLFVLFFLFYDGGKDYNDIKIATGHGPEDLSLDLSQPDNPRILISCSKRKGEDHYGKIQAYDVKSNEVYDLPLKGYDESKFRPHGIFLQDHDTLQYLYVISHEKTGESEKVEDKILKFKTSHRSLEFINTVGSSSTNPLMARTNDLYVSTNDFVYSTNPTDVGFSEVPANVVVIRPNGSSDIVVGGLLYPNGIYVDGNDLYVATAQGDTLYKFKLDQNGIAIEGTKEKVASITGGDNITRNGDELIIAHHPNIYKFVLHSMVGLKSPSAVTSYNIKTGKSKVIYGPSAKDISASSTGLIHDGYLYIAQVFENYIVKVPLTDLND